MHAGLQDDVAGCFDYYAGLAEKLDSRQNTAIDVGMDDFSVKVRDHLFDQLSLLNICAARMNSTGTIANTHSSSLRTCTGGGDV